MNVSKIIFLLLISLFIGCETKSINDEELIAEAEDFMSEYAEDLNAKDGVAVASRYHSTGSYFVGNGRKRFESYDSIQSRYEKWTGPEDFEWQDMSYEPISPDDILVIGKFLWETSDSSAVTISYTGLLKREDGQLRIRLEDESVNPMDIKELICPPDSTQNQ